MVLYLYKIFSSHFLPINAALYDERIDKRILRIIKVFRCRTDTLVPICLFRALPLGLLQLESICWGKELHWCWSSEQDALVFQKLSVFLQVY